MRLANIRNGLAYPHDDVCLFQSNHGHRASMGYFRIDAMPYRAVIHLLCGGEITIIDATARGKKLSDALRYGVPTWCMVFNRALGQPRVPVAAWVTREMVNLAHGPIHKPLVQTIRKLARLYPYQKLAIIGMNVHLESHPCCRFDDKPELLKELMA